MRDDEIHIGDVLQVRQWDDMVREFGVDEHGKIKTLAGFPESCKCLCGRQLIVKDIVRAESEIRYFVVFDGFDDCTDAFSPDELEPLFDEDWEVADDEQIKLLFG